MKIGKFKIGLKKPPFIVAELSGNHDGSLKKALSIVDEVAKAGAHAIKLQTYTPDSMTLNLKKTGFIIKDPKSPWKGKSLYNLYKKAMTPWKWHKPIFDRAKKRGLEYFSSPFDEKAVDFLESLKVPAYKIASFENIDTNLIKKVSSKKKPVIISTGMATLREIKEAYNTARYSGCNEIALLKCTSTYPCSPLESNLKTISDLRKKFKCEIGLSDHTMGIGAALTSISFGASIIEKHITLKRSEGGVDSSFSLEPQELSQLVRESKSAYKSLGSVYYGPTKSEKKNIKFRRSIYVVKNVNVEDRVNTNNIRSIRPGLGLAPKLFNNVIGKKFKKKIKKGTPLTWKLIR
tara:strand:- start:3613 stop:4656 length:1044 start_codon:yes stop_codon:yes gene_type:complete